jgi:hypothetical protein
MITRAGTAAVVLLAAMARGQADTYHWCANDGASRSGGLACYYLTLTQCQAAVAGSGSFCMPNYFDRSHDRRGNPDQRKGSRRKN